ncbi:MAG: ABC transporter ATP-binding protein [Candidatus Firestonebacteria bacterium]|nr:ABC transporter ATP-binding protein [Candidatus Firestonebacteria bacterium]
MSEKILIAKDIHKAFTLGVNHIEVLKGINLELERGELVTLLGPSGAGKSTLMNILGGISNPTIGTVYLNGSDLYKLNDSNLSLMRNRKIGFVFQFYNLLPDFTALENVLLPAMIAGKDETERAKELLNELGLGSRLQHRPGELSGGEQQRVGMARALINNPDILLADEPTGNLDTENARRLIDLFVRINITRKQTVLLVTHNMEFARLSKRIIEMKDGKVV